MKNITLRILCLVVVCLNAFITANAQDDVWRYEASSGKWTNYGDLANRFDKGDLDCKDTKAVKKEKEKKSLTAAKRRGKPKYGKSHKYWTSRQDSVNCPFLNLTVHNNAIYDAALALNGGLELSFGKKWSTGVDGYVAWLQRKKNNNWYQFYGFDLYGRYWFGNNNNDALTGFHVGAYAGTFTYDLYPEGKGYQCDDMFHTFHAGAEFGYSQYLTKKNRNWRVDFYGGLGLLHTRQDVYRPNNGSNGNEGYYFAGRRYRNMLDFTRFGITIGYMFGQKKK